MEEDTVIALPRPGSSVTDDPLLAVLREGARRMLTQAIETEVEAFLAGHAGLPDEQGRRRLVRNGHAPERRLQTGIGPLEVRRPKLRDRGTVTDGGPIRFTAAVLPAYLRRTKNLEELLPWLYLKGVSTGQFAEAPTALLGPEAPGLSPATVRRLTEGWQDEHERWQKRDLSARRYVYLWADGVYFTPRLEHERQCLLVLIGADASGRKELLAVVVGATLDPDQGKIVGGERAVAHDVALVRGQGEQPRPMLVGEESPPRHPDPPFLWEGRYRRLSGKRTVTGHPLRVRELWR